MFPEIRSGCEESGTTFCFTIECLTSVKSLMGFKSEKKISLNSNQKQMKILQVWSLLRTFSLLIYIIFYTYKIFSSKFMLNFVINFSSTEEYMEVSYISYTKRSSKFVCLFYNLTNKQINKYNYSKYKV